MRFILGPSCLVVLLAAACGDNFTPPVSIGGTVSGLEGTGLTLRDQAGDEIEIHGDGTFAFPTPVPVGGDFAVTVAGQPTSPTQTCSVANGSGVVTGDEPITAIRVTCQTGAFTIGGTVSGLSGSGLVLQNNGTDDVAVAADGTFAFSTPIASGAAFAITVMTQPSGPSQTCTVAGGAGTVGAGAVTTVVVDCATDRFTVGGIVSGLAGTVRLQNNTGDEITISANGSFAFPTLVASADSYDVTVSAQPDTPSQTCVVTSGGGTVTNGDITSVRVDCTTNTFTVGGTVTGLAGEGLVLQNSAGDNLVIDADGTFAFATPVASGMTYAVTVLTQPSSPTQVCSVTGDAGTVGGANVSSVVVTCVTSTFAIGGTVTGLAGSGLVLQDNAGDDLAIAADGEFTFAAPVASGETYAVTVLAQPSGPTQTCTVSGDSGTVGAGNVTSVVVNCATNAYTIGGTISGLAGTVVLQNSSGDDLTLTANGAFAFSAPVLSGDSYDATVSVQPASPSQTCTVSGGSGTVGGTDVSSIAVTCTTNQFAVGGTVTGLSGTGLELEINGGDSVAIAANGSFTFPTAIDSGTAYAVTVVSQPTGLSQTCVATNDTGIVGGAAITNVTVTCTTNTYRIGGVVSGLAGSGLVLRDNGGDDLPIHANGTFELATEVPSGGSYAVTIFAQPTSPWQTCVVTGGNGNVTSSDVTSVAVTCTTNKYIIRGTVTGLSGTGLVLQNNGGDDLTVTSNGMFDFATTVASGATFDVTVSAQPSGPTQTCTVSGGSGTVGGGDVASVAINCSTNRYTISGTVSGLAGDVVLQNNGGDDLVVSANGTFSFATTVASGDDYDVTVLAQPDSPAQTCIVSTGSGTVTNAAVADVVVTCTTNRYTIRGTVSGLATGESVVVRNNGADTLAISGDGAFAFPVTVSSGQMYAVAVFVQPDSPIAQECVVSNGTGTVTSADVTNVSVSCTTRSFTIGGTVTGVSGSGLVLRDNGGDDLSIATDGSFTFATPVASGSTFAVSIAAHPIGQICSVTDGSGTVANGNVTSVAITCNTGFAGSYSEFVATTQALGQANVVEPGYTITEANAYGAFYFQLESGVTRVRVTIRGAGGSAVSSMGGGSGGTGTVDVYPSFLADQGKTGFWVVLGQAGRPSAGPSGGTSAYRAFNGGGAGTDWSSGTDTYSYAAGGGGGSDVRLVYNGSTMDPLMGDPSLDLTSRFAVVGGGGGATRNGGAYGGLGGGFNQNGGNGVYSSTYFGLGATTTAGGAVGGTFGSGGDGRQDGSEGWAGGGGGGWYGGGAANAHAGGGGGSGYLLSASGLVEISTASGALAGNASTTRNGAFTITAF